MTCYVGNVRTVVGPPNLVLVDWPYLHLGGLLGLSVNQGAPAFNEIRGGDVGHGDPLPGGVSRDRFDRPDGPLAGWSGDC